MGTKTFLQPVLISAVAGLASAALVLSLQSDKGIAQITPSDSAAQIQQLTQKIAQLEEQLSALSAAQSNNVRQALTEPGLDTQAVANEKAAIEPSETAASFDELRQRRRAQRFAQLQPDYRSQQLIKAGFAQEEAERIVQLEARESLRRLNQQYQARRSQLEGRDSLFASSHPLRADLGDENYERYLAANGFATSVSVGSIIGGSPGENAGLRSGDNIISYAGERVFNLSDVNLLTAQGTVGQTVLIEVERNGESVQLSIPRGPIGVIDGRREPWR